MEKSYTHSKYPSFTSPFVTPTTTEKLLSDCQRKRKRESTTLTFFRFYNNMAMMRLDYFMYDIESQSMTPGCLFCGLRSVQRSKYLFLIRGRNTFTLILYRYKRFFTFRSKQNGNGRSDWRIFNSILSQVYNYLSNSIRITSNKYFLWMLKQNIAVSHSFDCV